MKKYPPGQALVIILLVMAVGLTVSLAVVSRAITDIRISQQEEESARAFSVAEAGIEESLKAGAAVPVTIHTDWGDITARVEEGSMLKEGGKRFDFGEKEFKEGEIGTVWLVEHNAAGQPDPAAGYTFDPAIKFCWGKDTAIRTAIEVSLIYKDGGVFKVARGAIDADSTRGNGFTSAGDVDGGNCGNLAFGHTFSLPGFGIPIFGAITYALRVKPLYNSDFVVPLAVERNLPFPSQGKCFISTATMPESGITRKVKQCVTHKVPPGIFDYVLFSGTDLVK